MFSLPFEVQLDIFKSHNYAELCLIKQTDLYFRDFIYKFEGELAREEFEAIKIDYLSQLKNVPYKLIKSENFDFAFFAEQHKEINEQIEQKWSNGLQDPIRLYLPDRGLIGYSSIICLTRVQENENSIRIQLPTIIKSKEDIKIVYYYLNKLFNCSFEYGNFSEFIFNPELLQLLFGNDKISKQIYVMRDTFLMPSKTYNSEYLLKFVVDHLICKSYRIHFLFKNTQEYIKILNKILMNGDKFKNVNIICSHSIPQLFDLVINYIKTSKDCSKMVDKIELNKIGNNFDSLNEKAEKVEGSRCVWDKPKYQLSNIYNPKIKFSIVFKGLAANGVEFERIYC